MTWARAKRYLAEHPVISLGLPVAVGTFVVFVFSAMVVSRRMTSLAALIPRGEVRLAALVVMGTLVFLSTAGWAFWIGCLRSLVGLPVARGERGAVLGWLAAVVAPPLVALIRMGFQDPATWLRISFLYAVTMMVAGCLPLGAACLGLRVASFVARRKIASGRWEVTGGLDAAAETPGTADDPHETSPAADDGRRGTRSDTGEAESPDGKKEIAG